nr:unnamed protein product [Callosobruchus chinensis]
MTNVFVGFHDQRSCSRILKPPGGGTSDIFGTNIQKIETPVKDIEETPAKVVEEAPQVPEVIEKPVEAVEVVQIEQSVTDSHDSKNGMNGDSETAKPEDLKVAELSIHEEIKEDKITAEIVNRKEECKIETHSEESRTKVSKQKIDTIGSILQQDDIQVAGVQKKNVKSPNRVPPGGYSSGLW